MANKMKRWGSEYPPVFSYDQSGLVRNIKHGNAAAVRGFLESEPQWLWYWYQGRSLLHSAAQYDHPEVISVLIDLGLDVNTPEERYPWESSGDIVTESDAPR